MGKIVWRERRGTGMAGADGLANGKLIVVSIGFHVGANDPDWVVRTGLPCKVPDDLRGSNDAEEAKRMAEKLVARFMKTAGASW